MMLTKYKNLNGMQTLNVVKQKIKVWAENETKTKNIDRLWHI